MKLRACQPDLYEISDFKNIPNGDEIIRKCLNKFFIRKGFDPFGHIFPFLRIRIVGNTLDLAIIGGKIDLDLSGEYSISNKDSRTFKVKEKLKDKFSIEIASFNQNKSYEIELPYQEMSFLVEQKASLYSKESPQIIVDLIEKLVKDSLAKKSNSDLPKKDSDLLSLWVRAS